MLDLTAAQQRVIGCLLEKEITTPDQYPLSLNALTNACNQKSNRHPVMQLTESDVQDTLDALRKINLVAEATGFGGRVAKYKHRFCNTEFGKLQLNEQELGIVCELLLRGPQTPGELRSRTQRLCAFNDVQQVESTLNDLAQRDDGPFVERLPREPGKREARYQHLFGATDAQPNVADYNYQATEADPVAASPTNESSRITVLEQEVTALRREVDELKQQLDELLS